MAKATTYKDPYGNTQTGYIIDGKTYKDQAGTTRIDPGSTVTTKGGSFTYYGEPSGGGTTTSKGSSSSGNRVMDNLGNIVNAGKDALTNTAGKIGSFLQDTFQSVRDGLQSGSLKVENPKQEENALPDWYLLSQQAQEEAKRAEEARINQLISQIQGRIPEVNQSYDDLAKQSYINYRLGQKGLNENLAAMGLSGTGAAESTLLNANNNYQNTLNEGELARQNAVQKLYEDIENARLTGSSNLADIESNYLQNLSGLLYNNEQWQKEFDFNKQQAEKENDRYYAGLDYQKDMDQRANEQAMREWAYTTTAEDYQQKLTFANLAAQMGDFSFLKALGIDTKGAEYDYAIRNKKSSSGSSAVSKLTYSQALAEYKAGNRAPSVVSTVANYWGVPVEYLMGNRDITQYPSETNGLSQQGKALYDEMTNTVLGGSREMSSKEAAYTYASMLNNAHTNGVISDYEYAQIAKLLKIPEEVLV